MMLSKEDLWLHIIVDQPLCNMSHLTEDDGEIDMNTRVVELHNSLEKKRKKKNKEEE